MDCREWKLFEILEIILELKELLIGYVLEIKVVTNYIQLYLYQFFNNSHSLKSYEKPSKRSFDQYQSYLKAINIGRDIKQIN